MIMWPPTTQATALRLRPAASILSVTWQATFSERDLQTQLFLTRNISTHIISTHHHERNFAEQASLLPSSDWLWLIPPLRTVRASHESLPCFSGPFWRSFLSQHELLLASLDWAEEWSGPSHLYILPHPVSHSHFGSVLRPFHCCQERQKLFSKW